VVGGVVEANLLKMLLISRDCSLYQMAPDLSSRYLIIIRIDNIQKYWTLDGVG
jgi:hypothetical protein